MSSLIQLYRTPSILIAAGKASIGGWIVWLLTVACTVLLVACQPLPGSITKPQVIRIAGATAMEPVLYDLTAAFRQRYPNVRFELAGGGSAVGEERVLAGQIDLAASILAAPAEPTPPSQTRRVSSVTRIPIGLDGLAVIVHQDNPVENLTLLQLQALYSGRLLNWAEVGGHSAEVLLTSREDSSGSRQLFDEHVVGEERVSLTAVVLPTDADVIDYVAEDVTAIGYVSRAYLFSVLAPTRDSTRDQATAQPSADRAPTVHLLAIEGQLPTLQSIQDQSYPLIQPLYLVSRTRPKGWLQQFIDFTLSPAGQAIVARYHARVR